MSSQAFTTCVGGSPSRRARTAGDRTTSRVRVRVTSVAGGVRLVFPDPLRQCVRYAFLVVADVGGEQRTGLRDAATDDRLTDLVVLTDDPIGGPLLVLMQADDREAKRELGLDGSKATQEARTTVQ